MGAREYDPALGRFTSADPLKGNPADPQMRNRYEYVANNPLVKYDLAGLYPGEDWVNAAVATATASMTYDWATGSGDEVQVYGPDDIRTQYLMDSPGVSEARTEFWAKNSSAGCTADMMPETYYYSFEGNNNDSDLWNKLQGIRDAGSNPVQQFVGSYEVDIYPNYDGSITFEIYNVTSVRSALYDHGPEYPRADHQFGGDMTQVYVWTEYP